VNEMKTTVLISSVVLVFLIALGVASYAYAQTQPRFVPGLGYRQGMMGGFGDRDEMMGGWRAGSSGYGPLHSYMVNAMADAFGLTAEDVQSQIDAGKTMRDLAQEQGLTDEQFRDKMIAARTVALNQAVSDNVITREQADWMLDRMDNTWQFGAGYGPCFGGDGGSYGGPGGRWRNPSINPGS
jgi:hypothetical protein